MKKIKFILMSLLTLLMFSMTSCSTVDVKQGTKALCVKRPYIFGSDGVEILSPGRFSIAWSTDIIPIDVRPVKYAESFNDLTPKDETPVDFDIYFNISLIENKVDVLYDKWGMDFYKNNLEQEFRELVRNKCKQYDMKALTNDEKVSQEICEYVKTEGNKIIKKLNIPVILETVNMGGVNPPESVVNERANTAAAKQREQTIIQETKNEKERQNKEREKAIADKAYQEALGLTKAEYLFLQELNVKRVGYEKANEINIVESGSIGVNKAIK